MKIFVCLGICFVFFAACKSDDSDEIRLQPGEFLMREGDEVLHGSISITLQKIEDSRCPSDVQCVRFGEAIVDLRILSNAGLLEQPKLCIGDCTPQTLHDSLTLDTDTGEIVLRLLDLIPYPTSENEAETKTAKFLIEE